MSDSANPRCLSVLEGHSDNVFSAAFDGSRTRVISGSDDNTLRLWDVSDSANPRCLSVLEGHSGYVNSAAFDGSGTRVISGSDDGTTRIWDVANPANPLPLLTLVARDDGAAAIDEQANHFAYVGGDAWRWAFYFDTRTGRSVDAGAVQETPHLDDDIVRAK